MRHHIEIVIVHFIGWLLISFGIIAFFLPFIPGVVFVAIGLYVISLKSLWFRKKLEQFVDRFHLRHTFDILERKMVWLRLRLKSVFIKQ